MTVASLVICSSCAGHLATDEAAVDYNRTFASGRNQVLLLNILRAWAHEPTLFSNVTQVAGSVRTGTEITLPFANILEGGDQAEFGPSFKATTRNPAVTIVPLDTRDFVQGMNRPVGASAIDLLIASGLPRSTVLALAVGGVQCGSEDREDVRMNYGPTDPRASAFRTTFMNSANFNVENEPVARLKLAPADALKTIKEGAGPGLRARLAATGAPGEAGRLVGTASEPSVFAVPAAAPSAEAQSLLDVEIVDDNSAILAGLNFAEVCDPGSPANKAGRWPVITRSVQSMIRYLAEIHRSNHLSDLRTCGGSLSAQTRSAANEAVEPNPPFKFKIQSVCPGLPPPVDAAIATHFRGQHFYIPRASINDKEDNTLQIFSILSELIALQISEQSVASSRPLIAIGQ
jgi:hypothetical protein